MMPHYWSGISWQHVQRAIVQAGGKLAELQGSSFVGRTLSTEPFEHRALLRQENGQVSWLTIKVEVENYGDAVIKGKVCSDHWLAWLKGGPFPQP